jgi:hypothetical protein
MKKGLITTDLERYCYTRLHGNKKLDVFTVILYRKMLSIFCVTYYHKLLML